MPLRPLVEAVAADPRNTWWSAPLNRAAQLRLVVSEQASADPLRLVGPTGPAGAWETYAQKPLNFVRTWPVDSAVDWLRPALTTATALPDLPDPLE